MLNTSTGIIVVMYFNTDCECTEDICARVNKNYVAVDVTRDVTITCETPNGRHAPFPYTTLYFPNDRATICNSDCYLVNSTDSNTCFDPANLPLCQCDDKTETYICAPETKTLDITLPVVRTEHIGTWICQTMGESGDTVEDDVTLMNLVR